MKDQAMGLGSCHESNDSAGKASVNVFALYPFSRKFLAGDEGDVVGCSNSNTKGRHDSKARAMLFDICTQLQDLFKL